MVCPFLSTFVRTHPLGVAAWLATQPSYVSSPPLNLSSTPPFPSGIAPLPPLV